MAVRPDIDGARVAEVIGGLWEDWNAGRRREMQKWDDCVKNYLVELDESKYENYPWRSRAADTFSQETADTIASNLRNMLFPLNEEYMHIEGLDSLSKGKPAAKMQEHQERMHVAAELIHRVMPWLKQLTVIGNAPFLLPWGRLKPNVRKRRQKISPTGRQISVESVTLGMREGVKFQCLDAYDVVLDPRATDLGKTLIIWRMEVSEDELQAMPNMENLEELDTEKGRKPEGEGQDFKRDRQRAYGLEPTDEGEKPFEVLLAYGDVVIDGQRFENQVVAVVNREVTARFEDQPFWAGRPIGWAGYDPLWLSVYAKGALESVRGTQDLINTFSNQKADILNLIINPMFKYVGDGILDPELLVSRPGGGVEVGTMENLMPISTNNNVALSFTEIEQLRARGERSTGASRFDMGQVPGGRRTAFEANLIRAGGSSRGADIVRYVANSAMEQVVNFSMLTTQQMKWPVADRDGLDEDTLLGDYYAQFTGAATSLVRQEQLQGQLLLLQITAQIPTLEAAFNMLTVGKRISRNLAMNDPELLNDEETYERRLNQLSQRQPTSALPQPEGRIGGADERLSSLVGNLQ